MDIQISLKLDSKYFLLKISTKYLMYGFQQLLISHSSTMHTQTLIVLIAALIVTLTHVSRADDGVPKAPVRPEGGFETNEELKTYLTELRRYYAVVSRPR